MATTPTNLPVPSESPRDLKFNAGKIDEFVTSPNHTYTDRFGNGHWTIAGINYSATQAISNFGYITLDSFEDGNNLTLPNQALRYEETGEYYRWDGELPKTVPPGSTPSNSGGIGSGAWVSVGDASLRGQLALYSPPGTNLIGTASGVNLTQYLARTYIFLDDIAPAIDGTADCSAAFVAKAQELSGSGVIFMGNKSSTYRLDNTLDLTGVKNVTFDFNWATIRDNVQGFIVENGGRAKHTFLIYNTHDVTIKSVTYDVTATRSNLVAGPYTVVFWVGGQYLGDAMTRNITLKGFRNITGKAPENAFIVSAVGELDGSRVDDFFIDGGLWGFGINLEYGARPVDPSTDLSMSNGRHPYNAIITHFSGQNIPLCKGFLRIASCYNIIFENCFGYNISNFIYGYGGDRNISRVSQNVKFLNCKSKVNSTILTAVNYAAQIIIVNNDGSTGEALPSWTNYDHTFIFENCEFWNNQTTNSSGARVFGIKGGVFNSGIFRNSYNCIWAGPSFNPDYVSETALTINNCVFKNNVRDLNIASTSGALICHNQFKEQNSASNMPPVNLSFAIRTKFRDNYFASPAGNRPSIAADSASVNCVYDSNYFELFDPNAGYAIGSNGRSYGSGNRTNGTSQNNLTLTSSVNYGIRGEPNTMIRDALLFNGTGLLNADIANFYTSSDATSIKGVSGGLGGDEIIMRGIAVGSNLTFTHAAAGVATGDRLVMKNNTSRTETGNNWSIRLKKIPGSGWYEL